MTPQPLCTHCFFAATYIVTDGEEEIRLYACATHLLRCVDALVVRNLANPDWIKVRRVDHP